MLGITYFMSYYLCNTDVRSKPRITFEEFPVKKEVLAQHMRLGHEKWVSMLSNARRKIRRRLTINTLNCSNFYANFIVSLVELCAEIVNKVINVFNHLNKF